MLLCHATFRLFMYRVELKNFEGPLDLLLFFIKKDELNIYDIPISYITRQFLDYINLMEELDLEVASEFILMASTLMSIKARLMLAKDEEPAEELSEDDPRYQLVQRLLQYKRYKEAAVKMQGLSAEAKKRYFRKYFEADQVAKQANGEALREVSMFELMVAFKNVLTEIKKQEAVHRVEKIQVTIEQQMQYVIEILQTKGRSSFMQLCQKIKMNRIKIVVTFLAILEMVKEQQIALYLENNKATDFYLDLTPVDELTGTK